MNYLNRYILLVFLIVNLTAEYSLLAGISKMVFYGVLIVSVPLCLYQWNYLYKSLRECPFLLYLIFIYVTYLFSVGFQYANTENLLYLVSKITIFLVMLLSINFDYSFYMRKFVKVMGYIIVILLVVGFNSTIGGNNRTFGFNNPNAACAIATIGATCFLFSKEIKAYEKLMLLFCIFCVIIGHSRNMFAMLLIVVLKKIQENMLII
mgnify:FL=1